MHDERYSSLRFSDKRDLGEMDKSDISQREEKSNGVANKNGRRDTLLPLVLPQVDMK